MNNESILKRTGDELAIVLDSENFPAEKRDALEEILNELQNRSQISLYDANLISITFPLMMEVVDESYGEGMHTAIHCIISSEEKKNVRLAEEINSPFAGYLKERESEREQVLDLSEHPENLNILASDISKILKNPATPPEVYNSLVEHFASIPFDTDSQEWILKNLQAKSGGNE